MITKIKISFLILFALSIQLYAQVNLYVQDPQSTSYYSKGTIEEAIFSVSPKGLFSQISSYLTFSGRGGKFLNNSQLEVVMTFTLPEGSFVTDLWLWLDDGTISKGKILDVWSASTIYEGIVKRRKDPAILKKTGTNYYELRVYPMLPAGTRKVKITYLTPVNWVTGLVSTPIPTEWLNASLNKPVVADLITWKSDEWLNPSVSYQTKQFENKTDTFFGDHLKYDLKDYSSANSYSLSFDNPMTNGAYLKVYKNKNNEGFYQLSFFPTSTQTMALQKTLFLIDYDSRKSNSTRQQVLDAIKYALSTNFNNGDKFNVFYSGMNIGKASSDWISASQTTITKTLDGIKADSISTYSNLPALLKEGYQFVVKKGGGNVCLISNSDQLGAPESANQVIADLQKIMTINVPSYVLDYADKNIIYNYVNGTSYYGNEYFYNNLTKLTGGIYQRIVNGNISNSLNDLYQKIGSMLKAFDFYTTLQDGFCYGRLTVGSTAAQTSLKKPILQVGKYIGTFPFIIKASGTYNSDPFSQTLIVQNESSRMGDDQIEKMWIGANINSLDIGTPTNATKNEIMNLSVANRILSRYTAFLALEDTANICKECYKDEGKSGALIGIEKVDEIPTEFSLNAYPNPFNSQVNITVKLTADMVGKNISFKIYNVLGQVVKTFTVDELSSKNIVKLFWNGKNDDGQIVSSGMYFFTVSAPGISKSLKLMYMK